MLTPVLRAVLAPSQHKRMPCVVRHTGNMDSMAGAYGNNPSELTEFEGA